MFDIGWTELVVIAIIAIIVIGPKDLPAVLRTAGRWARKARSLAREFQSGVDDIMRESEVEELRREINAAARTIPPEKPREIAPPEAPRETAPPEAPHEIAAPKTPSGPPLSQDEEEEDAPDEGGPGL